MSLVKVRYVFFRCPQSLCRLADELLIPRVRKLPVPTVGCTRWVQDTLMAIFSAACRESGCKVLRRIE